MYLIDTFESDNIKLAESLVIKHIDVARAINKEIIEKHGSKSVTNDKKTWKYFLNLSGQKHFTNNDVQVRVVELDKEMSLSIDILNDNPYTKKELLTNTTYYNNIVNKYPDDLLYIKGCMYPVDIDKAISAKEGTILNYNSNYVEAQEYDLIRELETYIKSYLSRYNIWQYTLVDELYLPTILSILYANIPGKLMALRMEKSHTNQAHSFHLEHFFRSHFNLTEEIEVLNNDTKYWLYKNLPVIIKNIGKESTLNLIFDKILTPNNVGVGQYKLKVKNPTKNKEQAFGKLSYTPNELVIMQDKKTSLYNLNIGKETDISTIVDREMNLLDKTGIANKQKWAYIGTDVKNKIKHNRRDDQTTKILEMSTFQLFNRSGTDIFQVLVQYIIYMAKAKQLQYTIEYIEPNTNRVYALPIEKMALILLKILLNITGNDKTKLTNINYYLILPESNKKVNDAYKKIFQDEVFEGGILPLIRDTLPESPGTFPSTFMFSKYLNQVKNWFGYTWTLDSNLENKWFSANLKALLTMTLQKGSWQVSKTGKTIDELLDENDILYQINDGFDTWLSLETIIYTITNIDINEYRYVDNLNSKILDFVKKLTSYTLQFFTSDSGASTIQLYYNRLNIFWLGSPIIQIDATETTPLEPYEFSITGTSNNFENRMTSYVSTSGNYMFEYIEDPILKGHGYVEPLELSKHRPNMAIELIDVGTFGINELTDIWYSPPTLPDYLKEKDVNKLNKDQISLELTVVAEYLTTLEAYKTDLVYNKNFLKDYQARYDVYTATNKKALDYKARLEKRLKDIIAEEHRKLLEAYKKRLPAYPKHSDYTQMTLEQLDNLITVYKTYINDIYNLDRDIKQEAESEARDVFIEELLTLNNKANDTLTAIMLWREKYVTLRNIELDYYNRINKSFVNVSKPTIMDYTKLTKEELNDQNEILVTYQDIVRELLEEITTNVTTNITYELRNLKANLKKAIDDVEPHKATIKTEIGYIDQIAVIRQDVPSLPEIIFYQPLNTEELNVEMNKFKTYRTGLDKVLNNINTYKSNHRLTPLRISVTGLVTQAINIIKVIQKWIDAPVLVVKDKQVVEKDNLYEYKQVTVEGTGLLKYKTKDTVIEITSDDLVITRNTYTKSIDVAYKKYRNIIVLDYVIFRLDDSVDPKKEAELEQMYKENKEYRYKLHDEFLKKQEEYYKNLTENVRKKLKPVPTGKDIYTLTLDQLKQEIDMYNKYLLDMEAVELEANKLTGGEDIKETLGKNMLQAKYKIKEIEVYIAEYNRLNSLIPTGVPEVLDINKTEDVTKLEEYKKAWETYIIEWDKVPYIDVTPHMNKKLYTPFIEEYNRINKITKTIIEDIDYRIYYIQNYDQEDSELRYLESHVDEFLTPDMTEPAPIETIHTLPEAEYVKLKQYYEDIVNIATYYFTDALRRWHPRVGMDDHGYTTKLRIKEFIDRWNMRIDEIFYNPNTMFKYIVNPKSTHNTFKCNLPKLKQYLAELPKKREEYLASQQPTTPPAT